MMLARIRFTSSKVILTEYSGIHFTVYHPSFTSGPHTRLCLLQSATVLTTTSGHPHQLLEGGGSVTVDLPTITTAEENGGVLLCNLDELSRYIPENFYTDFNDTLEATTATVPTANTVSAATGQQQQQQQPQQPTIQARS